MIEIINKPLEKWESNGGLYTSFLCDPPYFLSFMQNAWDTAKSSQDAIDKAQRWGDILIKSLQPGALGMMFSSPRTQHYTALGMEKAGFRVLDCLQWIYSSGMSKSLSIDKLTEDSRWEGHRTPLLKTAYEPILLFQAPMHGMTYAELSNKYGTGTIDVAGTRIPIEDYVPYTVQRQGSDTAGMNGIGKSGYKSNHVQNMYNEEGRFPSNIMFGQEIEDPIKKYFFVSKPSQKEKHVGTTESNFHPTPKPITLIKYLAQMLLPPHHIKAKLLIPFSGSGSEVIGAMLAGWDDITSVEQDAKYCLLQKERIEWWKANSQDSKEVSTILNKAEKNNTGMLLF